MAQINPSGQTITQYNVVVGAANNNLANVAPSATSGVPVISQGAAANPAFGTAVVAGGGTGVTSTTAYGVVCGGTTTTNPLQNAGAGTTGQVLMSNGASALPTWAASSSSGAWVLLSTQDASASSNINFTSLITSSYTNYIIVYSGVTFSNNVELQMLVSTNNGSSYLATGYRGGSYYFNFNVGSFNNLTATTFGRCSTSFPAASAQGGCGILYLWNTNNSSPFVCTGLSMVNLAPGSDINVITTGWSNTATTVNAIRLQPASNTITTGRFSLYGLNQT